MKYTMRYLATSANLILFLAYTLNLLAAILVKSHPYPLVVSSQRDGLVAIVGFVPTMLAIRWFVKDPHRATRLRYVLFQLLAVVVAAFISLAIQVYASADFFRIEQIK